MFMHFRRTVVNLRLERGRKGRESLNNLVYLFSPNYYCVYGQPPWKRLKTKREEINLLNKSQRRHSTYTHTDTQTHTHTHTHTHNHTPYTPTHPHTHTLHTHTHTPHIPTHPYAPTDPSDPSEAKCCLIRTHPVDNSPFNPFRETCGTHTRAPTHTAMTTQTLNESDTTHAWVAIVCVENMTHVRTGRLAEPIRALQRIPQT